MRVATKHSLALVGGGCLALWSTSLPWSDGLSLLQLVGVFETMRAFPMIPLSYAGSELSRLATYAALYVTTISASFLVLLGHLRLDSGPVDHRPLRLGSIAAYGVGVLLGGYRVLGFGGVDSLGSGFVVFLAALVVFVAAEALYGGRTDSPATAPPGS